MGNYKVRLGGALAVVEDYENTGTITSKVFTVALDDFDKIAKYIIEIDGRTTAALVLSLKINGVTTGYYADGQQTVAGAQVLINYDNAANMKLATATVLSGNTHFKATIEITYQDITTNARYLIFSRLVTNIGFTSMGGTVGDDDALTTMEILVDTSSLAVGTRITLYKLSRQ